VIPTNLSQPTDIHTTFRMKVNHLVADIYLSLEGTVERESNANVLLNEINAGGPNGSTYDASETMDDETWALRADSASGDQTWMYSLDEPGGSKAGGTVVQKKVMFREDVEKIVPFDPTSPTNPGDTEGDNDDGGYDLGGMFDGGYDDEFEEIIDDVECPSEEENEMEDTDCPPNYLVSAVLAGLYELPPLWLLKTQTGFGRRVRYKNPIARRLNDVEGIGWKDEVETEIGQGMKIGVKELVLPRFESEEEGVFMRKFQVFKIDMGNVMKEVNSDLVEVARRSEIEDRAGISVSNAGGSWHSRPEFFEKWRGRRSVDRLWDAVVAVMNFVENKVSGDCLVAGGVRKLALDKQKVEAWVNISKCGSWNRLHTHEGAAWSGVYYVERGQHQHGKGYSGRLVLKPTPHFAEDDWDMRADERERFLPEGKEKVEGQMLERAHYWDEDAENCTMMIFPSWLHHAVLPYFFEGDSGFVKERISVALNVSTLRQ